MRRIKETIFSRVLKTTPGWECEVRMGKRVWKYEGGPWYSEPMAYSMSRNLLSAPITKVLRETTTNSEEEE